MQHQVDMAPWKTFARKKIYTMIYARNPIFSKHHNSTINNKNI